MKKAGFIFGAKYGRGFTVCCRRGGSGWSAPAAMRVEGGVSGFRSALRRRNCVARDERWRNEAPLVGQVYDRRRSNSGGPGWPGRERSDRCHDERGNAVIFPFARPVRGYFVGRRDAS